VDLPTFGSPTIPTFIRLSYQTLEKHPVFSGLQVPCAPPRMRHGAVLGCGRWTRGGVLKKAGIRAGLSVVVIVLETGLLYVLSPTESGTVPDFRDAGLEVGEAYPVEEDTGWNESRVPKTHQEGTSFEIPSLGEGARGRVLV
jgi:hypothetical protein